MKKTTYIIIALVVVPFVLALTSPFWLSLYVNPHKESNSNWIEASTEMTTEEILTPIRNVEIQTEGQVYFGGKSNLIIRKGDSHKISYAWNLADYVSYTIDGETLIVKFSTGDDDNFKNFSGNTLVIIETPAINSVKGEAPESLNLEGFEKAKATIDFDSDTYLTNCTIDSLFITNTRYLNLTNSVIGCASADVSSSLGIITNDSRIYTLKVVADAVVTCDVTDTNIGVIQLETNGNDINLRLNHPTTIDYVNND